MHLVINSECQQIPEKAAPLTFEGNALLHFLLSLSYDAEDPPLADLLRQYHHLEGEWFVLTPIHWQATHNDAMIAAFGAQLQLKEAEAKGWFDFFSEYLAQEGITLYYHDAYTWLLCTPQNHPLNAKPVHHLIHQSLMPQLAQMDKTLYWQKLITEFQMLCASKSHDSLMNGLWIWGGAKLKNKKELKICADESFLNIAQIGSMDVTLYNSEITLKEYQVLVLTEYSMLSEPHQEELKKIQVHWYWNNAAYITNPCNWLTRLWRTLIHAH
jgi:hypothetical protein